MISLIVTCFDLVKVQSSLHSLLRPKSHNSEAPLARMKCLSRFSILSDRCHLKPHASPPIKDHLNPSSLAIISKPLM